MMVAIATRLWNVLCLRLSLEAARFDGQRRRWESSEWSARHNIQRRKERTRIFSLDDASEGREGDNCGWEEVGGTISA